MITARQLQVYRDAVRALGCLLPALVGLSALGCGGSAGPFTAASGEEPLTIEGRVTAGNGEALAGAEVLLGPGSRTAVTDPDGRYRFEVEATGEPFPEFTLAVRSAGYESVTLGVIVGRSGTAVVDVALRPAPEPPPEPGLPPFQGIVVDGFSPDEVFGSGCLVPGTLLAYTVTIANEGTGPSPAVILHDTLDTGFGRSLTRDNIAVDRSRFPEALVTLDSGGRSFRVELGSLPPMPATEVYTVRLPMGEAVGVHCNRVTATDADGAALADAASCVTQTLAMEIDVTNEDGAIVGGAFTAAPEVFRVGDGGPGREEALVFRVVIDNAHCFAVGFPVGEVVLTSFVGARSGALEFREVLPGFPSRGSVSSSSPGGFVWSVGSLGPGEVAEIRFRAEAVREAEDTHRVELSIPQFTGTLVDEEPITILP